MIKRATTAKKVPRRKPLGGGEGATVRVKSISIPSLGTKIQKGSSNPLLLQNTIDQKILELEQELLGIERAKDEYRGSHKIEFFAPFPHQQSGIGYIRDGKKTVLVVGANRVGKSVFGVNAVSSFSLGCRCPWDGSELYPSEGARQRNGREVNGRILCNDWEKAARDTIVPLLKEWLPAGSYETKKNNVGVDYEFYFPKTKSRITILTYKEDTKSHEGKKLDWILCDEPPPRDKYIANRRGLVDCNGICIMAMTAISEPWILDEIVLNPDPSTGIVSDIPIEANTTLGEEAIRIFASSLSEDEKVARLKGGWLQLTGRVWKGFRQQPVLLESGAYLMPHVVHMEDVPREWPVEFQIDFHLNIQHAISFCACDPRGIYWICGEVWENCGSEELAEKIIAMKEDNHWRMKYGEIDALSKGDVGYAKNRFGKVEDSFSIIERKLRKYGLRLGVGSKDEKSYIKAVETRLKGPNGVPTLYIADTCKETIKQVSRWGYDDKGKPKDDGHFPECIGRFTQTGLKYMDPYQVRQPQMAANPMSA